MQPDYATTQTTNHIPDAFPCIPDTIRKARKGGNTGIRSNTTHFRNYEFTNPKRDEDSSCWCCLKKHNIYYYISDQIIKLALVEPC